MALITGLITEDNLKKSQKFGFKKKSLNHVGIKSLLNSVLNQYGEKILGLTQDQLAKDELKGCGLNDVCFGQRCQNDQNSTKGYECLRVDNFAGQWISMHNWHNIPFCSKYPFLGELLRFNEFPIDTQVLTLGIKFYHFQPFCKIKTIATSSIADIRTMDANGLK